MVNNPMFTVMVDVIPFTLFSERLRVLLIKKGADEYTFCEIVMDVKESLEDAARRALKGKTGLTNLSGIRLEQLYTYDVFIDNVITVIYYALIKNGSAARLLKNGIGEWFDVESPPRLNLTYKKIFDYTLKRLGWKAEYSTIVFSLIPESFSLSELKKAYELVLGRELDRRNFVKKIIPLNIIKYTGRKQENVSYRPAKLYRLKSTVGDIINVF